MKRKYPLPIEEVGEQFGDPTREFDVEEIDDMLERMTE